MDFANCCIYPLLRICGAVRLDIFARHGVVAPDTWIHSDLSFVASNETTLRGVR